MLLPMTKAAELFRRYAARLADPVSELSELELHRAAREAQEALRAVPDAESAGLLWMLLSLVRSQLGRHDEALDAARNAVHSTPLDAGALMALGVMLGRLGRHDEALSRLQEARRHTPIDLRPAVLCNLSAALANLGRTDEAEDVLAEAVHGPPPTEPNDFLRLSIAAAVLSLEEDALVLIARYITQIQGVARGDAPALEILDAAPLELRARVMGHPILARAIEVVRARERSPIPPELGFRTHMQLSPEAWAKFTALAGS